MPRRILFVTPVIPFPPDTGGAQRTYLMYQALKRLGTVDTVVLTPAEIDEERMRVLRDDFGVKAVLRPDPGGLTLRRVDLGYGPVGVNVHRLTRWLLRSRLTLFRAPAVADQLRALIRSGSYDVAVGRYLWSAVQTGVIDELPTFLDFDDLESEIWQSRSEEAGGRLLKAYYRQIGESYATRQRQLARRLAGGWVAKGRDAEALGRQDLLELANIPFANFPELAAPLTYRGGARAGEAGDECEEAAAGEGQGADTLNVLGVAAFDYRPNLLGFEWFVTQVWPRVIEQVPHARLHLVGKLSDAASRARWSAVPGVHVHGRVPELAPHYEQALFTVAPIFQGGGTNIKVIEALVYGRCCVGTSHAVKGFEGLSGLREGSDAEGFAAHCIALLRSPRDAVEQGREAARDAAHRFSFERFAEAVRLALDANPGAKSDDRSVAAGHRRSIAPTGGAPGSPGIR